jgi:hypothetical protein
VAFSHERQRLAEDKQAQQGDDMKRRIVGTPGSVLYVATGRDACHGQGSDNHGCRFSVRLSGLKAVEGRRARVGLSPDEVIEIAKRGLCTLEKMQELRDILSRQIQALTLEKIGGEE